MLLVALTGHGVTSSLVISVRLAGLGVVALDQRARRRTVPSYDDPKGLAGNVVNEVTLSYDG